MNGLKKFLLVLLGLAAFAAGRSLNATGIDSPFHSPVTATGGSGSADDLGNHTATQDLDLNGNDLNNAGSVNFTGTGPSSLTASSSFSFVVNGTTYTIFGSSWNFGGGALVNGVVTETVWMPAAGCNNATASPIWDLPTSNAPSAACRTGTNTQKGVLDFDMSTDESAQTNLLLPTGWTGNLDAKFVWSSTTTETNSAIWNISVGCAADNESDDPAFNSVSTVTDAYGGTSASKVMVASVTGITTTGCAAGEVMAIKVNRDADNGSDSLTGDARLIGVELTLRKTLQQ